MLIEWGAVTLQDDFGPRKSFFLFLNDVFIPEHWQVLSFGTSLHLKITALKKTCFVTHNSMLVLLTYYNNKLSESVNPLPTKKFHDKRTPEAMYYMRSRKKNSALKLCSQKIFKLVSLM